MPARRRAFVPFLLCCAAVVLIALPVDSFALGRSLGGMDSKQRLWLAAFGGLSIGIAFGLIAFELRSRALAVAIRRLIDLIVGMDGRFPEDSRRKDPAAELQRLSDELMFTAQRAARDRRETEQKMGNWEAIFAAALDAMFTLDAAGRITYINPAAERLFRVKADESIGKPLSDVMLPPTHRSPDNAAFANDLATGKAQGRTQELVAQRGDGRQFPVEVSIGEFGSGERRGFVVIARDISQVRRGRAELNRMREHLTSTEAQLRAELEAIKREQVQNATAARAAVPQRNTGEQSVAHSSGFTVEDVCGEALRKLAARAERRALGFRYEDSELQGMVLLGDSGRLRRVLIELVDSAVRTATGGEIVVHLATVAGEGRNVQLVARVTATAMSEADALRTVKPFINETVTRSDTLGYPGRADIHRAIDVLGTRVTMKTAVGGGAAFAFQLPFEADLSQVAIDLSALPAVAPAPRRQGSARDTANDPARLPQEFAKSAARLRKHSEKPNLIALWAEAHRLKNIWQRQGGRDDIGLVSALSHTARGGDATNAILLARRLADALDAAARVAHRPPTVGA